MEFDFLPKLPNSNLDDRAFKDLVEECLLRIPRYCPEWTNHNPSDPGVTLIELFAWLTDQMQLRFNQVPRRYYVAFLELLGIRLAPPNPAEVNLTFYLSSAQPFPVQIPRDVEVATERTATEEAIVFSTDESLIIGNPRIKHFLTADSPDRPATARLRNRFIDTVQEQSTDWQAMGETPLFAEARPGNCFYLILDTFATEEAQSIQGNVLELSFQGEAATGTGINPDEPPRVWQAWNGKEWQTILRTELDDHTDGFNFEELEPGQEQLREASVILHLPPNLPETDFETTYRGYWIRCVYQPTREEQPELQRLYSTSPRITGLRIQSIGGTVRASQCIRVQEELIGISNGKPGQQMQLQMQPLLERRSDQEYIEIRLPGQPVERWQEVKDFGNSLPDSPHYTIDSQTGIVQFGPLIRGPRRLQQEIDERGQYQASFQPIVSALRQEGNRRSVLSTLPDAVGRDAAFIERQYGKVPPPGAEIYITSYRFGGGKQGNVQPEKLTVMRSALSYISRVTNYEMAIKGADADSLEEAVMRVPEWLRTRECAVTPEDFETVVKRLPGKQVARVHCLRNLKYTTPGVVRLLVVPQVNTERFDWTRGMNPDTYLSLEETATNRNRELRQQIITYLSDRRPLGIQVQLQEPEYVGVSVRVQVLLDQAYNNPRDRAIAEQQATAQLLKAMYQFFNPLTGGNEGTGWRLGRPVYVSDVVALCQKGQGIRHVGAVQLYEIRKQDGDWVLFEAMDSLIEPGAFGLICSWADGNLSFAPPDKRTPQHEIQFID